MSGASVARWPRSPRRSRVEQLERSNSTVRVGSPAANSVGQAQSDTVAAPSGHEAKVVDDGLRRVEMTPPSVADATSRLQLADRK